MSQPDRTAKGMWWDRAWSLVEGCTPVSDGCTNCWSATQAHMRSKQQNPKIRERYEGLTTEGGKWNGKIKLLKENLGLPLRTRKPTRWAVWNDLFHPDVPDEFRDRVFAVMALTPQHTYQILTKRPDRMLSYLKGHAAGGRHIWAAGQAIKRPAGRFKPDTTWPLPNVWLGNSVENQQAADERIPLLRQTPAAVHWVSCEPLLSYIDLTPWLRNGLSWVVVGGETGPGARPMHPDWVRSLRDQCQAAGVAFWFKQWGEWVEDEDIPICRICGCTDEEACPGGCYWVEDPEHIGDLCNRCVGKPAPAERPIIYRRVGKKAAGCTLDNRTWKELPGEVES